MPNELLKTSPGLLSQEHPAFSHSHDLKYEINDLKNRVAAIEAKLFPPVVEGRAACAWPSPSAAIEAKLFPPVVEEPPVEPAEPITPVTPLEPIAGEPPVAEPEAA
jgi:hypothetical protein